MTHSAGPHRGGAWQVYHHHAPVVTVKSLDGSGVCAGRITDNGHRWHSCRRRVNMAALCPLWNKKAAGTESQVAEAELQGGIQRKQESDPTTRAGNLSSSYRPRGVQVDPERWQTSGRLADSHD